ncbi:MAG: hypothetical protein KTV45_15600 [Acidimicrobiia bacterium]|nr:hypothetical protein [Acidimicrobiia bacterium]
MSTETPAARALLDVIRGSDLGDRAGPPSASGLDPGYAAVRWLQIEEGG